MKFKWNKIKQDAFDEIKRIVDRNNLSTHPDFIEEFKTHTDARYFQFGAVIIQKGKLLAFYSTKTQKIYTVTERELIRIVETLKGFRSILLGQRLIIYTDHKKRTYNNFNTYRVLIWRLILEEYAPEIEYIKGDKNIV